MKTKLITYFIAYLISIKICYPQWIQTDGPYSSINISTIFQQGDRIYAGTNCGLHSIDIISDRWTLRADIDTKAYSKKGDTLFFGNDGVSYMLLSNLNFEPVSMGLSSKSITTIKHTDTCLYVGGSWGFYKSNGFSSNWKSYNNGLPFESDPIPQRNSINEVMLGYHINSIEIKGHILLCGTQQGIYKSDINNISWTAANNGLPQEEVHLLLNINDTIFACIDNKIYYSINDGDFWIEFYIGSSRITSICNSKGVFYVTSLGNGIYFSKDNGLNWNSLNSGLIDLQITSLFIFDTLFICGSINEGVYYKSDNDWINNKKGLICSSIRSMTVTSKTLFSNDFEKIYISNNGLQWNNISPNISKDYFSMLNSMGDTVFLSVEFNKPSWPSDNPFIVYTNDDGKYWNELINPVPFAGDDAYRIYCYKNRLYAYEDEIMYYTDDLGASWTDITIPDKCYIYDILVYNSIPFVSACGNGNVFKLTSETNWVISNSGLPSDLEINDLAKTTDAIYAYVMVHGMYVSKDDGLTWSKADNGLDAGYWGINSFAFSDKNIFVTTENGIFYSDNYGQNWYALNDGLINRNVGSIVIFNDTLFVGTCGNGIWKHDIASIPLSIPENIFINEQIRIYPNPASNYFAITTTTNLKKRIQIIDIKGEQILSEQISSNDLIDISNIPNGAYFILINTDKEVFTTKLLVYK